MARSSKDPRRAGSALAAHVVMGIVVALLTACGGPQQPATQRPSQDPDAQQTTEEPSPPVVEEPAFTIEEFDFGNAEWLFVPYAEAHPTLSLEIVDGGADLDGMTYTVGADEAIYSDADGDGDLDAIVPIEAYGGGNSIDRQWYIWVNDADGAVQVGLPVARSFHCGTFTESVAATDGGFEIHEFRRTIGEESLACTDRGSDERVRTVGVSAEGPGGALWPVQTVPFRAFGGICPAPSEYDAYPFDFDVYPAPSKTSAPIEAGETYEWQVDPWPVYTAAFDEYALIGVNVDGRLGCAWGRKAQ